MILKAVPSSVAGAALIVAFGTVAVTAETRVAAPGQDDGRARAGKVGGADCDSASQVVEPLPFVDVDTTCGAPAVVSDYNSTDAGGPCDSTLYAGPEKIYRMQLGAENDVTVRLMPIAPADLAVFVVSDCVDTQSCVGFQDVVGGGAASGVRFVDGQFTCNQNTTPAPCPALGAGTYWIYVDSFFENGSSSCGQYTLTVSGTLPVELIEFEVE